MRIAVFGGSFNPPHVGHVMVSQWLLMTGRSDAVWFVPTFVHPFGKELAPFERRLSWCVRVAELVVGVSARDVERHLPAPSFTIDTLLFLQDNHPDHAFRLVMGADLLANAPRWKQWETLKRSFPPLWVGRQGWPTPEGAIDFPGVSSTEVRERAVRGEDVSHLVPACILEEVKAHYGGGRGGPTAVTP